MEWPSLKNAKSKMRGSLKADGMEFEEYEMMKGVRRVPVSYDGFVNWEVVAGSTKDGNGKTSEFRLGNNLWQKHTRSHSDEKESSDDQKLLSGDDSQGSERDRSDDSIEGVGRTRTFDE